MMMCCIYSTPWGQIQEGDVIVLEKGRCCNIPWTRQAAQSLAVESTSSPREPVRFINPGQHQRGG